MIYLRIYKTEKWFIADNRLCLFKNIKQKLNGETN